VFFSCPLEFPGGCGKVPERRGEREKSTHEHIPIIALTANTMRGDRESCLVSAMDDYVSKPIQVKELFAAIERALSSHLDRSPSSVATPEPARKG
jgi:DNA-binding response OmpR family regulator